MKTLLIRLIERYNLWQVMRYGFVGLFVASCHAATALLLHRHFHIDPTISNFSGFIVGAVLSYLGSYYFTFKSTQGHKRSLPRFALVWLIGIVINVGLFKTLLNAFEVPFALNVFIAIALTPIAQYLMLHFWAFKNVDE